jgi:CheY-like chemotaxis protein
VEIRVGALLKEIEKITNETFLKNIQVCCDFPADLWSVLGDPTQLHQVLLNLCVNARDAMLEGGRLTLAAGNMQMDKRHSGRHLNAKPGPYVLIRVEDTGTGMPPEVVERIFDPFFTTKEPGKGTGLGLSTTLTILKSHQGFLHVESQPGLGSRFDVFLPAHLSAAAEREDCVSAELPRGNGELVLVIDDENDVLQIIRQILEAYGYRVMPASGGAEAVAMYSGRMGETAAVLTDMMMPLMDGEATIQALRAMNPAVRIIASGGLAVNGMLSKAINAGAKRFIPKPYTAETLLGALQAVLHA